MSPWGKPNFRPAIYLKQTVLLNPSIFHTMIMLFIDAILLTCKYMHMQRTIICLDLQGGLTWNKLHSP